MNKFLKRMLTAAVAAAVTASGMSFASSAEPDDSMSLKCKTACRTKPAGCYCVLPILHIVSIW